MPDDSVAEAYVARPVAERAPTPGCSSTWTRSASARRSPRCASGSPTGGTSCSPRTCSTATVAPRTSPRRATSCEPGEREAFMAEAMPPRAAPNRRPRRAGHPRLAGRPARARRRGGRTRRAPPATAWVPGSPSAPPTSTPRSPPSAASTAAAWSPRTRTARTWAWSTPGRVRLRPRRPRPVDAAGGHRGAGRGACRRRPDRLNEVYAGAAHGYSMADTSAYDEAATERHFLELEALLARRL